MNIVLTFMALRSSLPNLQEEYTVPIRRHSFLPADCVFGRIEQSIRKFDTILLPEQYHAILRKHGNVNLYGEDWVASDFKSATQAFVKTQRPFKMTYAASYWYHSILKRGKRWGDYKPNPLPMVSTVKDAKKHDAEALLNAIGAPVNVKTFYNEL